MGKEKGTAVLVKVGQGDSPETFTAIAGQRTGTFDGSAGTIDVSDKTNLGWQSFLPGLRNASISCGGVADWPDQTGLQTIIDAWLTEPPVPVNMEMVINQAGDMFRGPYYVTQLSIDGPHDGATSYTLQFSPSDAVQYVPGV